MVFDGVADVVGDEEVVGTSGENNDVANELSAFNIVLPVGFGVEPTNGDDPPVEPESIEDVSGEDVNSDATASNNLLARLRLFCATSGVGEEAVTVIEEPADLEGIEL